jgi:hypothetical protein
VFVFEIESGSFEFGDHGFEKPDLIIGESGFLGVVSLGKVGVDTFDAETAAGFKDFDKFGNIFWLDAKTAHTGVEFNVDFGTGLVFVQSQEGIGVVDGKGEGEFFPDSIVSGVAVAHDENRSADLLPVKLIGFVEGVDYDIRRTDMPVNNPGNRLKTVAVGISFENRTDNGMGVEFLKI